jgi:hypothetical protein
MDDAAADGDDAADAGDAAVAAAGAEPIPATPAFKSCKHYNQSDVAKLRHQLMVLPGEVDILMTCEWPAGVLQQLPAGTASPEGECDACCWLRLICVCGSPCDEACGSAAAAACWHSKSRR